jgi:hypothetical protein
MRVHRGQPLWACIQVLYLEVVRGADLVVAHAARDKARVAGFEAAGAERGAATGGPVGAVVGGALGTASGALTGTGNMLSGH